MSAESRRVLVTGATGFIGSHVADVLLEAGYQVRCTVRRNSNLRWLKGKPLERVVADLRASELEGALDGVTAVVHCAGLTRGSGEELFAANREATRRLAEVCAQADGTARFVYCSSQAAAGPGRLGRPREVGDPPAPISDYGRSKLAGEREVEALSDRLETVVLRPVAVYGPRDEDTLPYFRMAARGVVVAPGLRTRWVQVVHVRDVARALCEAMTSAEAPGRTYFVGHPEVISWRQLAEAIGRSVDRRTVFTVRVPSAILRTIGALAPLVGAGRRPGQIDLRRARDLSERAWTCRVDEAIGELGWAPNFDLSSGLTDAARWYKEVGWL